MAENKVTQKERKRIEILKRKFQLEQERVQRPVECNKYLKAIIDSEVVESTQAGSKIVEKLTEIGIVTHVSRDATPNTVTWKRRYSQKVITDEGEVLNGDDFIEKDEPYLMVILQAQAFISAVKDNRLFALVQAAQEICSVTPVSTTLVVYGLKNLIKKHKNITTMKEVEIRLAQLQMLANCSHRMHENPDDLAATVVQISKAIAEEPFKNKQNQKIDQEQFFLTSEVKVGANDNDPDSLARLWHSQLTCLPKVTFDVAQSITKEYNMPRKLIEACRECGGDSNSAMLADIPILKTGPLSKQRKIGPELSRKVVTLMTSKNLNDLL